MRAITKVTIVAAIIIIVLGWMSVAYAQTQFAPSQDPKVTAMQDAIVITDNVLAETRTFRYAVGGVGAAYGAVASGAVAATAGLSVPMIAVASVAGGVVYGASFYGASTLGAELVYQDAAKKIKEGRSKMTQKAEELKEEMKEELKEKKQAAMVALAKARELW
jgi:hypothetical protein